MQCDYKNFLLHLHIDNTEQRHESKKPSAKSQLQFVCLQTAELLWDASLTESALRPISTCHKLHPLEVVFRYSS